MLGRLRAEGRKRDLQANREIAKRSTGGQRLGVLERSELFRDAPIAVSDEVAGLLYALARRCCGRIVEFGGSLGVSTIHLAAGIHDSERSGRLITTEIDPVKAAALEANLREADLEEIVEVRAGDALQTLRGLDGPVDLLFLDGWNELYLPVLELVEPSLSPDGLVVADLTADDPDLLPYLQRMRDTNGAWMSATLPLDAGVEISLPRVKV